MEIQIRLYLDKVESYLKENISDEGLKAWVVEAWKEHDKSNGAYKNILRAIICAMGGMEEVVKNDGADFLFGFMFSYIGKFGEKYCEVFRNNIEQHPKMQKYQISPHRAD